MEIKATQHRRLGTVSVLLLVNRYMTLAFVINGIATVIMIPSPNVSVVC